MARTHGSETNTTLTVLLVLVIVAMVGFTGWYAWHAKNSADKTLSSANKETASATVAKPKAKPSSVPKPNDQSSWLTFTDTGQTTAASGVSFKYPSDWQVRIGKTTAAGDTTNPSVVVDLRTIQFDSSSTPEDEWKTCADKVSADACGIGPNDKIIEGSSSQINGRAAYSATIQSTPQNYQVTIIKSDKPKANGTFFVEFSTNTTNRDQLNTFKKVVSTASFIN